jgi:hypothetical protein
MALTTNRPAGDPGPPRPADGWTRLWRLLAGWPALLWVGPALLAAALTLALPQMPTALAGDPAGQVVWLAGLRGALGPWAERLAALGLLAIEQSPLYRILLAAALFSALLGLYEALRKLAGIWALGPVEQPESYFGEPRASVRAPSALEPGRALDGLARRLRARGWRVRRRSAIAVEYAVADRPWGLAGRALARLGLVLLVLGFGWTAWRGWRAAVVLAAGHSVELAGPGAAGGAEVLRLEGMGAAGARVALNREGRDLAVAELGPGAWTLWPGALLLRMTGGGPALRVSGEGANGQPLVLKSCQACPPASSVTLLVAPDVAERSAFAPRESLALVAEPLPGDEAAVQVTVLALSGQDQEELLTETVRGERRLAARGVVFRLAVARYAQLDVWHAPGLALALAGALLGGLGLLLGRLWPYRRVWALAAPEAGATQIKLAGPEPAGLEPVDSGRPAGPEELARLARLAAGAGEPEPARAAEPPGEAESPGEPGPA